MKDIKGYKGLYAVTKDGRVWSYLKKRQGGRRGKFLRPFRGGKGYLIVGFCKKGRVIRHYIHRLVGKAFIPNHDNLPEINHKNGIKTDNHVGNLEWCTRKHNVKHAIKIGLMPLGMNRKHTRFTDSDILRMRAMYEVGYFQPEIAKVFKTSQAVVSNIVTRKARRHVC